MKTRILALCAILMLGLSSLCFASADGGCIEGVSYTDFGQKLVIYTPEGYSVATVLEYRPDAPLEKSNVIEVADCGWLTDFGRIRVRDLHTGSGDNVIQVEGIHLTEMEALHWLANGGNFD